MFNNAFLGKRVLITGHTGFKGSWLSLWLNKLGAEIIGVSNTKSFYDGINSDLSSIFLNSYTDVDILHLRRLEGIIHDFQPDFVFHLAAQALVSEAYRDPVTTFQTNAMGTINVLNGLKQIKDDVTAVFVTSDKVYENVEWKWGYRENDAVGGRDPYSASKGMAELAISSYTRGIFNSKNGNIRIGVGRAGNVIGGGDWSKNRLVPDCFRSWFDSSPVVIRSPNATRPWQHVMEPISGYLTLAADLSQDKIPSGEAYNFGPVGANYSVQKVVDEIRRHLNKKVNCNVEFGLDDMAEAVLLQLNCDKASFDLLWRPTLSFSETIKYTVDWYSDVHLNKICPKEKTFDQIQRYAEHARRNQMFWSLK